MLNKLFDVHYLESHESAVISLKEKYAGVKFTFGEIKFNEADDEEYCTMSFDYDIIDTSTYELQELLNDNDFARYVGSILESILREAVEQESYKIGKLDAAKNSDDNPKEPTQ
jgi:hypothetical protein